MKFKLFGRLFKPKNKVGPAVSKAPGDRKDPRMVINELVARGLPEAEIIRSLKDAGYSFKEIDDALNESVRNEVEGPAQGYGPEGYGPQGSDQYSQYGSDSPGSQQGSNSDQYLNEDLTRMDQADFQVDRKPNILTDSTSRAPPGMDQVSGLSMPEEDGKQPQQGFGDMDRESVYEVVESVVSERITSLRSEMKETNDQLKSIQQIISEFKAIVQEQDDARRKELGAAHEKIKDASVRVMEIEPRVSGLEKAFKDIVPNLVDSVREIKELVHSSIGDSGSGFEKDHIESAGRRHEHEKDIFDEPPRHFGEHDAGNLESDGGFQKEGERLHSNPKSDSGKKSVFE